MEERSGTATRRGGGKWVTRKGEIMGEQYYPGKSKNR